MVVTIGGAASRQREYTGWTCCSTSDSARAVTNSAARYSRSSPARAASGPVQSASTIGCISRGGPGSSTTIRPSCSSHNPGAVPFGFGSTVAPRGTIA